MRAMKQPLFYRMRIPRAGTISTTGSPPSTILAAVSGLVSRPSSNLYVNGGHRSWHRKFCWLWRRFSCTFSSLLHYWRHNLFNWDEAFYKKYCGSSARNEVSMTRRNFNGCAFGCGVTPCIFNASIWLAALWRRAILHHFPAWACQSW